MRARNDLHKCIQYSVLLCGYITAFYLTASHVVDITDNEILDRFFVGLKPKICE